MTGPEEMQGRLTELEATVRGLTHELVEANERIRALEDQLDEFSPDPANKHMPTEDDKAVSDGGLEDDLEDDIIVA